MESGTSQGSKDLYGLVLVGGRSSRLGRDKAQIRRQGKKSFDRAYELVSGFCASTFLSGRQDQKSLFKLPFLSDNYADIGPLGGISTALRHFPNRAWLVLAVDYLLMNADVLRYLIERRNRESDVSLFLDDQDRFHPLCAIYEPSIGPYLKRGRKSGQYALYQMILQAEYHALYWPGGQNLFLNLNRPEDLRFLQEE